MDTKIRNNIDWVGALDWTNRDFHGYKTSRGVTYNSYLVRDVKTALIDAVKRPFADELLKNIAAFTDHSKVDYVVCNHAEPDHSSALPVIMKALPNATLVCDKKCADVLGMYYDTHGWKIRTVSTGDTISLGKRTLHFIETPMVHWPESMFTYIREEKLLFSMDAFGQHYTTSERFDDEVPLCTAIEEAKIYYANIVMLYGKQVARVLEEASKLEIETIAPSHGIIWRSHVDEILKAYGNWANYRVRPKVLVIYDSMWGSTGQMARAISEGATRAGVETKLVYIRASDLTRIATEFIDVPAVAFGSSTLNQGMMPMAGAVLTYVKGLKPLNKAGFAFGSYGWGKGGPEAVDEWLKEMKWEIMREPLKAKYKPTAEVLEECHEAGKMLAEKALEMSRESGYEDLIID